MKKTFIIILIIIIISLFSLPSYVELNNLIIVEGSGVKCNKDSYNINSLLHLLFSSGLYNFESNLLFFYSISCISFGF